MSYDPIGVEGLEARVKEKADANHEQIGPVFYIIDEKRQMCACDGCARAVIKLL